MPKDTVVIIPAYNEEHSIAKVINEIPRENVIAIIVVDNNSSDNTARQASEAGAITLSETSKGYGSACLKGISYIEQLEVKPYIVVFLDGDYSDYPAQLSLLTQPIYENGYDLVIGSRMRGNVEKGALTIQQKLGNKLASLLLKTMYNAHYTDLGPFRAIKYASLLKINMKDKTFGWTVEMQIKAAKLKMKTCEVPVNYRKRIGFSKISGTVKGTLMAGYKIIFTMFKYL